MQFALKVRTFRAMNVYTYWDSSPKAPNDQVELFRIWEHSWRKNGWKPRLLTEQNVKSKSWPFKTLSLLVAMYLFNASFTPRRLKGATLPALRRAVAEARADGSLRRFDTAAEFKASGLCL